MGWLDNYQEQDNPNGVIKETPNRVQQFLSNIAGEWNEHKPQLMKDFPITDFSVGPMLDYISGKSDIPVMPVGTTISKWTDTYHLGDLKNVLPSNYTGKFIERGVSSKAAVDDFLKTGIIRNNKSAGLPLSKRSQNYGERVFFGPPSKLKNNYTFVVKNSDELTNRPVTYKDVEDILMRNPNGGYTSMPNWKSNLNPQFPKKKDGGELKAYNPDIGNNDSEFLNWYNTSTLEGQHDVPFNDKNSVYDFYSYYRNTPKYELSDPKAHFPDTFKYPNHPTFSNESIYSTPENPGGKWEGETYNKNGNWLDKYEDGGDIAADGDKLKPYNKADFPCYAKVAGSVFGSVGKDIDQSINLYNTLVNYKNSRENGKMSKDEINYRKKLANAQMFGYPQDIKDLHRFIERVDKGTTQDVDYPNEYTKIRKELVNKYYDIPQDSKYLIESKYKPSISESPNARYYEFNDSLRTNIINILKENKDPIGFIDKVTELKKNSDLSKSTGVKKYKQQINSLKNEYGIKRFEGSDQFDDTAGLNSSNILKQLGRFKTSVGKDEKGKYISVYDNWDIDPPYLKKHGIDVDQLNNPFEIYTRFYENEIKPTHTFPQIENSPIDKTKLKPWEGGYTFNNGGQLESPKKLSNFTDYNSGGWLEKYK